MPKGGGRGAGGGKRRGEGGKGRGGRGVGVIASTDPLFPCTFILIVYTLKNICCSEISHCSIL